MNAMTETKRIFKEYLKHIAHESKSKFDEVQAIIYSTPEYKPLYLGAGNTGIILKPDGNVKTYTIREIVGVMLSHTYSALGVDVDEEVSDILKRVHADNPTIPLSEMSIIAITVDALYRDVRIYLYHKTDCIKELSWEYLLGDNAEPDEETETVGTDNDNETEQNEQQEQIENINDTNETEIISNENTDGDQ